MSNSFYFVILRCSACRTVYTRPFRCAQYHSCCMSNSFYSPAISLCMSNSFYSRMSNSFHSFCMSNSFHLSYSVLHVEQFIVELFAVHVEQFLLGQLLSCPCRTISIDCAWLTVPTQTSANGYSKIVRFDTAEREKNVIARLTNCEYQSPFRATQKLTHKYSGAERN